MLSLNGVKFDYRPGMSLKELIDEYNADNPVVSLENFIVVVNGAAVTSTQALELQLQDDDSVFMAPMLEGG